jgi:hypothetical protein
MILTYSEFSGDICALANVGNEMKPSGMKFAATKTMCEV